jgi:hypothetical protein
MHEETLRDEKVEDAAGEQTHWEQEPLRWQAHLKEEMQRLARKHQPAPGLSHFAEEYAAYAMRGVEADANEYQHAAERGENHDAGEASSYLADAGDIAGG